MTRVNDARDLGAALERLRFDVTILLDADEDAMRDALQDFRWRSYSADIALVFFAGHGLQAEDGTYLLPANAAPETVGELEDGTTSVESVVRAVAPARVPIVILDASGLYADLVDAPDANVLVAYTAVDLLDELNEHPSQQGDGTAGRNGPFAESLLRHLEQERLELVAMFGRVGAEVAASTGGHQRLMLYSALPRSVWLAVPSAPSLDGGCGGGACGGK